MADELPYKAEYAKSGRSSCKFCKSIISKDSLRVAKMVQVRSRFGKLVLLEELGRFYPDNYISCDVV